MSEFQDMLNFDAFGAAEAITGKSYKDDEETRNLGMLMHMRHTEVEKEELALRDDTYYGVPFTTALTIFHDLGFVDGYERSFVSPLTGDTESHMVLVHPDGILMNVNSYGDNLNSATMFYQWEHDDEVDGQLHMESGHYSAEAYNNPENSRKVWIGSHDARIGIRHTLDVLRNKGRFLSKWVDKDYFLWLLSYADERDSDNYEEFNKQVLSAMSPAVQEMVLFSA